MSSSRPSPSSRDDNSFSSRSGGSSSGGGNSRPDSSRAAGSPRSGAESSRPTQAPPATPKMNTPRAAAGTGAGAASQPSADKGTANTPGAAGAGASASALKWGGMAGLGALALGGYLMWNSQHQPTSATSPTTQAGMNGRGTTGAAPAAPGKLTVFVGADVSRSVTPTIRETSMDGLKFALRQAVPTGTSLHFVFYDKDARTRPNSVEFYEPRDLDEVAAEFKKYTSRPEKGTTQAFALKRLRQEASELPAGTPYAFVLITDGEDYDRKATREQASELAAQTNFRGLMVIGAQMESKDRIYLRDQIQDSLSPLGNKRLVCGAEVSEHDTDTFQSLMSGS